MRSSRSRAPPAALGRSLHRYRPMSPPPPRADPAPSHEALPIPHRRYRPAIGRTHWAVLPHTRPDPSLARYRCRLKTKAGRANHAPQRGRLPVPVDALSTLSQRELRVENPDKTPPRAWLDARVLSDSMRRSALCTFLPTGAPNVARTSWPASKSGVSPSSDKSPGGTPLQPAGEDARATQISHPA